MMTTEEIARQLVANCEAEAPSGGMSALYHADCVSVEAMVPDGMDPEARGTAAIKAKHDWWYENFEVHESKVDGPYVNGDRFSVIFEIDATEKATGQRMPMKEVGLYFVENGKIVREEFQMKPMPA